MIELESVLSASFNMAEESDGVQTAEVLRFDKILVYTALMILYFAASYKLFRRHRWLSLHKYMWIKTLFDVFLVPFTYGTLVLYYLGA